MFNNVNKSISGKESGKKPNDSLSGFNQHAKDSGSNSQSANAKKQVEDIFSETDKAMSGKPKVFQPKQESSSDAQAESLRGKTKTSMNKNLLAAAALLGVVVLAFAAYWAYSAFLKPANQDMEYAADENKNAGENNIIPNQTTEAQNQKMPKSEDSDQDGLTDEEEAALGTSSESVDSDNDGLFDREEVKAYKTDPLNPDTDGDGYLDGEEVDLGYNPNGEGMLFRKK